MTPPGVASPKLYQPVIPLGNSEMFLNSYASATEQSTAGAGFGLTALHANVLSSSTHAKMDAVRVITITTKTLPIETTHPCPDFDSDRRPAANRSPRRPRGRTGSASTETR